MNGVFGSLFAPSPRLGIVDEDGSAITSAAHNLDGISVTEVSSAQRLREMVESNDLDAGLILQDGFDEALRAGEQPLLQFYIGGESLASNRIILSVTTLDLIRRVAGEPAPVEVDVVIVGDAEAVDIASRLLPMLVVMAVAIAGGMVPAAALVDEKERGTINALLVTPSTIHDVLAAKAGVGIVLAVLTGIVTLALNNAFGPSPLALTLVLVVAAVMMAEFGLMLGAWAKDANTLFAAWKSGAILLIFPVIFYIWPGLPQWIAKLGPTYYFLEPMFEIAVKDAALGDVWGELAVAGLICVALLPLVGVMARRLEAVVAASG